MTVIRMSVVNVTASLAAEISVCAVIVYNHRLGRRKGCYNCSIKPAPGQLRGDKINWKGRTEKLCIIASENLWRSEPDWRTMRETDCV